jgi:hypothetical protein
VRVVIAGKRGLLTMPTVMSVFPGRLGGEPTRVHRRAQIELSSGRGGL